MLIPTITLMSTLPPMVLLLLKGLLVLPPLSILLARVRSGPCQELTRCRSLCACQAELH